MYVFKRLSKIIYMHLSSGRLVTVKFLTLKRYHQRFPESIDAKEHLKPSGMSSSTIPKLESAPVNESDSDSDS